MDLVRKSLFFIETIEQRDKDKTKFDFSFRSDRLRWALMRKKKKKKFFVFVIFQGERVEKLVVEDSQTDFTF